MLIESVFQSDYTVQKRRECRDVVNDMARKYQRTGLFLNEIIDQERNLENTNFDSEENNYDEYE